MATITDSLRAAIAAAAVAVLTAGASAGPAAPAKRAPIEAEPTSPVPGLLPDVLLLMGPLGHGQNDRPVPFAAGSVGHAGNESLMAGLQPNFESRASGTGSLGALSEVAALFGAGEVAALLGADEVAAPLGPNDPRAALFGGEALESAAVLLGQGASWLDDDDVMFSQAGGAGPTTPVPAPGALSLLGLAALAAKRRRCSG